VGGVIPSQFISSVEKGIVKKLTDGVVAFPMVDVKVTLDDGKHHPVDSSDMAFQIAGSMAIQEAAEKAGVAVLEPIMDVEVLVPESLAGDVIGDLNAKRGKVLGMDPTGTGKTKVRAQVPQAEMTRYAIDLRSLTGGRGIFTMAFSHYEEVPPHLADRLVADAKTAREEAR
jgi:elongation factor G